MKICFKTFILIFLITTIVYSQNKVPRLSPKAMVGQTIGYTDVEIHYGSPGVKGRKIWGGLVSYDTVWRAGANEATTIEFSNDVLVNGNYVPAGKYSFFLIPTKSKWVVILNKVYDQWGAFKYNQEEDLLRFYVTPQENHFTERLKYSFEYKSPYIADVIIEWEKIKIRFSINTKPTIKETK